MFDQRKGREVEVQTIFNIVGSVATTALGWFARELWAAVKELKTDLAKLREELPQGYVTKDDYREDIREIKNMTQRIYDKLDHKADKP